MANAASREGGKDGGKLSSVCAHWQTGALCLSESVEFLDDDDDAASL